MKPKGSFDDRNSQTIRARSNHSAHFRVGFHEPSASAAMTWPIELVPENWTVLQDISRLTKGIEPGTKEAEVHRQFQGAGDVARSLNDPGDRGEAQFAANPGQFLDIAFGSISLWTPPQRHLSHARCRLSKPRGRPFRKAEPEMNSGVTLPSRCIGQLDERIFYA
jgi:hypothetical protein